MSDVLIQVGLAELRGLESRIRRLRCDVDSALYADFRQSPAVADSYSNLMGKWKKNRAETNKALGGIADALGSIIAAFDSTDTQLAAALDETTGTS